MQTARGAPLSPSDGQDDPADSPTRRRLGLFVAFALVAYVIDVATKIIAVDELEGPPVETVTVVPHVLELTLVRNSGAAFGIATGFTAVLTVIAVSVCIVVIRMAGRLRDPVWAIALGLLLGGALGNLTDRFARDPGPLRGHVVDFLAFPDFPVFDFPVFNLADTAVTIAAVLIAVQSFRGIGLDGRRVSESGASDDKSDDA